MFIRRLDFLAVLFAFVQVDAAHALITTAAEHAVLMDAETGDVLWAKDAEVPMPPASMSKLMTLEMLFQRLKDGRMKLTDTLPVSERAMAHAGLEILRGTGCAHSCGRPDPRHHHPVRATMPAW